MGDWNTLHFFNERKFQEEFVPVFKGDRNRLSQYFNSKVGQLLLEDFDIYQEERIDIIMDIANKMDDNFIVYSKYLKALKSVLKQEEKKQIGYQFEDELEDFQYLLSIIIFTECAPFFPYFRMGKGLSFSNLKFTEENTKAEYLFDRIRYCPYPGNVLSFDGIRSWMKAEETKELYENFHQIQPNIKGDSPSHNKSALSFVDELRRFLSVAVKNEWGLIWCCNHEDYAFKDIPRPIGKKVNWKALQKKTPFWIWKF